MKTSNEFKVELLAQCGSDQTIAEAAWVSTDRAKDRSAVEVTRLLKYLVKHNHWTPFGQTHLQFRFHIPIFVARQLMRSNVGIVWNEESRRYVQDEPIFYVPEIWRAQSKSLKQGSEGVVERPTMARDDYLDSCHCAYKRYTMMLMLGVASELARAILPVATYTTLVGSFSLASAARVVALRVNPHAQWEIQQVAKQMDELVRLTPMSRAWDELMTTASQQDPKTPQTWT